MVINSVSNTYPLCRGWESGVNSSRLYLSRIWKLWRFSTRSALIRTKEAPVNLEIPRKPGILCRNERQGLSVPTPGNLQELLGLSVRNEERRSNTYLLDHISSSQVREFYDMGKILIFFQTDKFRGHRLWIGASGLSKQTLGIKPFLTLVRAKLHFPCGP